MTRPDARRRVLALRSGMRTPFVTAPGGRTPCGGPSRRQRGHTHVGCRAGRFGARRTERSQILSTLHVLTDVYGPRLTGSPNLKQAGEWAVAADDVVGLIEREAGAVGLRPSRLAERTLHGASGLAGEGCARRRSAGVDAVDERRRARRRVSAGAARSSLGRIARHVSRWRRRQGQRARGARRHASEGRRHLQPGGQAAGRGRGARPVRRGEPDAVAVRQPAAADA